MRIKTCHRGLNIHTFFISMLALLLSTWTTAHGQGSPWIVDVNGNGDFTTIQAAIDIAQNGDEIYVMAGTYYGTGDLTEPVVDMQGKSLHLQKHPDEKGPVHVDGNNKRRCLVCDSGEGLDTVIESITFRNGYADRGGGLYALSSSPTLKECVFTNNNSNDRGGAVYIEGGNPSLENCVVTNNTSGYGGGFYIRQSLASMSGGYVAGNQASGRGGGFRIIDASPTIYDVQIESNWAIRGGGGHIQENSAPTFQNCTIRQNTADSLGGGMAHSVSSPAVYQNCTFIENAATGNNGGQGSGGGVYSDGSTVLLQACDLLGNQAATYGGGVYCWYSNPTFVNTTFQNNVAGNSGGAIRTIGGSGPQLIYNNLLCENTPDNIAGPWDGKGTENCIGDSCDDDDLDGIIDACDDDVIPTLEVPNEYATVQEAYDAAEEGNVILVHPGTHLVSSTVGLLMEEKGAILRSVSGPEDTKLTRTNTGRIITCYDLPDTAVIDGFTITGGQASWSGGISLQDSDIRFNNCIIEENGSAFGGGFTAVGQSEPILTDCVIQNNHSLTQGAGVWAFNGPHITLINCSVDNNLVANPNSARGAGACATDADISLIQTGLRDNYFSGIGKGTAVYGSGNSTILIDDSNLDSTSMGPDAEVYVEVGGLAIFSRGSGIDAIKARGSGTRIQFVDDSLTDISSDIVPPPEGAMIMEIGELDDYRKLLCTGDIVQQGCLTLTNPSGTLLDANVGDRIDLIETMSFTYNGGTAVFPPMPVGLGLQIYQGSPPRSGFIWLGVEVIEVDTPDFDDPFTSGLDEPPIDMVAIDVDHDGDEELAVLFDGTPGSVWVYDISEDAPPVAMPGYTTFVGNSPVDIDAGDLDGDGDDDLIVANAGDQTLNVLNTFSSTFTVNTVSVPSGLPTCAAVIDWDDNGSLDAVVGVDVPGTADDGFQIILDVLTFPVPGTLFNTNSYSNGLSSEPDPPTTVSGGDDVSAWGFAGGTRFGIAYHAQQGDTSLTSLVSSPGQRIRQVTAQDIDENGGDGLLDVIIASDEAEIIFIVPGTTTGFDTAIPIMVEEPIEEFVALDVEDDGDTDLIITCPDSSASPLLLLRNDEPGTPLRTLQGRSWAKQTLASSSSPRQLASGTLDPKDEEDDWIIGGGTTTALRDSAGSMEQTTFLPPETPCPGDVNDDQVISIDDLLIVIGNYGNSGEGDANEDGIVNIEDLLIVLDAFGQTCNRR